MLPSLKSGEVLRGRYSIIERIGQGGVGSIYLAEDTRLKGRQCALKEVEYDRALPENIRDEARDQFLREATVLARLDHPNLPKVSDFFSNGPRDYLVMDYVPGKDLRTLMLDARRNKKFLSEKEVLAWAEQIANALTFLHSQEPPIVHRDIKPSNVKVMSHGLIKLVDFGLVKILAPDEVTITVIQGQGTALYTPLEQYGGNDAHTDIRSDVYAFGATMYHLLTNEPPADARKRFLSPKACFPYDKLTPPFQHALKKPCYGPCPCTRTNDLRRSMISARHCLDIANPPRSPSLYDAHAHNPYLIIYQIPPKQCSHGAPLCYYSLACLRLWFTEPARPDPRNDNPQSLPRQRK